MKITHLKCAWCLNDIPHAIVISSYNSSMVPTPKMMETSNRWSRIPPTQRFCDTCREDLMLRPTPNEKGDLVIKTFDTITTLVAKAVTANNVSARPSVDYNEICRLLEVIPDVCRDASCEGIIEDLPDVREHKDYDIEYVKRIKSFVTDEPFSRAFSECKRLDILEKEVEKVEHSIIHQFVRWFFMSRATNEWIGRDALFRLGYIIAHIKYCVKHQASFYALLNSRIKRSESGFFEYGSTACRFLTRDVKMIQSIKKKYKIS